MDWHLYILDCDGRFYTGICKDVRRRLEEHRSRKTRAARFTRAARNHELVYAVGIGEKGMALRAEARLKKLPRRKKEHLVREAPAREHLLALLGLDAAGARE